MRVNVHGRRTTHASIDTKRRRVACFESAGTYGASEDCEDPIDRIHKYPLDARGSRGRR